MGHVACRKSISRLLEALMQIQKCGGSKLGTASCQAVQHVRLLIWSFVGCGKSVWMDKMFILFCLLLLVQVGVGKCLDKFLNSVILFPLRSPIFYFLYGIYLLIWFCFLAPFCTLLSILSLFKKIKKNKVRR